MSDTTEKIEAVDTPDPIAQAIAALTEAARGTRILGRGTDNEQTIPADFGEIACHVLTAVAANMGGVEELLAGRPGSWEADYVRQIVGSTAGHDEAELRRWRTDPVRVGLDVEGTFDELGLYRLYEDEVDVLARAVDAADDALWEAVATDDEKQRLAANIAARQKLDAERVAGRSEAEDRAYVDASVALYNEAGDIIRPVHERATAEGHPLAAALAAAQGLLDAVNKVWEQDQVDYVTAYRSTVNRLLSERGMRVDVELVTEGDWPDWDELTDELHQEAREQTPLPMTGEAPDWTLTTPAESLRRAGLLYTDRAKASESES
jgi:hypothetical protein